LLVEILSCAALAAALLLIGWRRWADPWMDFGREVLIARRISDGGLFGRDILHLFGPLSGHLNGAALRIAGPSLRTLFALNLAVLVLILAAGRYLLGRIAARSAAAAVTLVSLPVFFLGRIGAAGSFNYIAPYSHELVHGYLLALASMILAHHAAEHGRAGWAFLAGCAAGALLLTKYEMILAGLPAIAFLLVASPGRRSGRIAALFLAGLAVAPGIFFACYAAALGPRGATEAVFGSLGLPARASTSDYFYRTGMGLDRPAQRLLDIAKSASALALALFALALAGRAHRRILRDRGRRVLPAVLFLLFLAAGVRVFPVLDLARVLPISTALFFLASLLAWRRTSDPRNRLAAAYSLFALLLLSKMILYPRFHQYGFVLAAPATACLIVAILDRLPRAIRTRAPDSAGAIAAGFAGLLAALMVKCVLFSWDGFRAQDLPIGRGPDRIFVSAEGDPRGYFALAHDLVLKHVPPEATLAVLPEGGLINQTTGRRSPLSTPNFMPAELRVFGEERILAELARSSPDYILIHNRPMLEFRMLGFGFDFGKQIMRWVQDKYYSVDGYGTVPLEFGKQGAILLRRR
jgi:hypothetical protein